MLTILTPFVPQVHFKHKHFNHNYANFNKCLAEISTQPLSQTFLSALSPSFPVVMYGCESWTIKKAEQ